jgi:hypothetical protein
MADPGDLVLSSFCHPDAAQRVVLRDDATRLEVQCSVCGKVVASFPFMQEEEGEEPKLSKKGFVM